MKINKILICIFFIISIGSIIILFLIPRETSWYDLFLSIFMSSMIIVVTAIVTYNTEKRKAINEIFFELFSFNETNDNYYRKIKKIKSDLYSKLTVDSKNYIELLEYEKFYRLFILKFYDNFYQIYKGSFFKYKYEIIKNEFTKLIEEINKVEAFTNITEFKKILNDENGIILSILKNLSKFKCCVYSEVIKQMK